MGFLYKKALHFFVLAAILINNKSWFQGGVQFPTGGIAHDRGWLVAALIW